MGRTPLDKHIVNVYTRFMMLKPKAIQTDLLYNLNEASRVLGRSPATISYWLDKGELVEAPTVGKQRMITVESLRKKAEQIGVELKAEVTA